ncbi:DUF2510 domain-containing protein [Mycobacterium sp. ELW1]|uniref:DUF2510 domain-containing protein n=1 Tax=Mycobacterium sp. ELW1 TaxID=1547487 RepID=UPI0011EFACA5|nr:DUF2510 domain-containing protein [Mycobacterium sp. ELW1]
MATEPGWYPDPLGGQGARYWDGTQWDGAIQPGPPTGPLAAQEFPELPPPPVAGKSRRLWPLWALGAAVVIAIGATVFVLTRPAGEPPPSASTITPTTTATPSVPKADQVAAEVQSSMQSKLDTDPDLSPLHLKVVHVDLVNKAGNEFKGIAQVKTSRGTSRVTTCRLMSLQMATKRYGRPRPARFCSRFKTCRRPPGQHRHRRRPPHARSLSRSRSRSPALWKTSGSAHQG